MAVVLDCFYYYYCNCKLSTGKTDACGNRGGPGRQHRSALVSTATLVVIVCRICTKTAMEIQNVGAHTHTQYNNILLNRSRRRRIDCYFPAGRPTYHCHPRGDDAAATKSQSLSAARRGGHLCIILHCITYYYYMTGEEEDPKTEMYKRASRPTLAAGNV